MSWILKVSNQLVVIAKKIYQDDNKPKNANYPLCYAYLWSPIINDHNRVSDSARIKLSIVIHEETLSYLSSLIKQTGVESATEIIELIACIKQNGVIVVWPYIKQIVIKRMFDEYGKYYYDEKDRFFIEFIESGRHFNIEENHLNLLQQSIQQQADYQLNNQQLTNPQPLSDKIKI